VRYPGLGNNEAASGKEAILINLNHPFIISAGIMVALSLVFIPFCIRFIITPLILFHTSRRYHSKKRPVEERWHSRESRELSVKMFHQIKKILYHSESFQVSEDIQSLLGMLIPPDAKGSTLEALRFNFTPVRFLETLLMAYEDLHNQAEKRFLLRYLLKRQIKWFLPFQRGMAIQKIINKIPLIDFFNRKGLFSQVFRLVMIPLFGLPGLLFYSIRSLVIRSIWAGLIRYYYTIFLLRASYYLIYLYGGDTDNLSKRCERFSRNEIIRKGLHYDRELSLMPDPDRQDESLSSMILKYKEILEEAGFVADPLYTMEEAPRGKKHRLKTQLKGLMRRSLSALHQQLSEDPEKQEIRKTAIHLLMELPGVRYPGSSQPWQHYRIIQGVNVGYRLLMISLSRVYANAPGSHFAMERISVDLIRQARNFSRQPLISLLSRTGKVSYKAAKPLLRLRKLNKLRKKASPGGVISLSIPLLGKLIQDRWKELILYRLGRAIIRYSLIEEDTTLL